LLIGQLRSDAYEDHPAAVHNQGFVPQLVVRGSTAPMQPHSQPHSRRSSSPDPT